MKNNTYNATLLVSVGNHATDEVGLSLVEGGHQVIKLTLEVGRHCFAALSFLPSFVWIWVEGLTRVVPEAFDGKGIRAILDHLDLCGFNDKCIIRFISLNVATYNGVIEGVFVLVQPSSEIVGDCCCIVNHSKVSVRVGFWMCLRKLAPFAQHVGH